MIKQKQKDFNKMKFEPKYLLEINEASNFQTKFTRDLSLCQNNTSFLGGLQITLEEMLPQGRYDLEDYKSQMNLINNEITTTEQFFAALKRVYDYYKSGKVGQYFREQFEKKQVHFSNKKEYYDNEKKKNNQFKKGDYGIVPLRNMKCYHCKRKGHLMSECRLKNKNRPNKDNKGKNYSKDKYSKDKKYKKKKKIKEMNILTRKEENGNQETNTRNGNSQEKEKTHTDLKKKEQENHHFIQKIHQDNFKRRTDPMTKKNSRIRKCGVITVKQTHILPTVVINIEKKKKE